MAADDPVHHYVSGFRARLVATRRSGQRLVDAPGIVALLGTSDHALDGRALVTSDEAVQALEEQLPVLSARVVNVFGAAQAAHRLLSDTAAYRLEPCTAMVHHDLAAIPEIDLPEGLALLPVRFGPGPAGGVAIEEAAAAALRSDPSAGPIDDLDDFVAYLRSVPNARYLAAVDADGVVRATAAAATFGRTAAVFFVNTDPSWRGRGVGTAMTAAALRAAVEAGAANACLDASALGLSLYLRLGFRSVSPATLFIRQP